MPKRIARALLCALAIAAGSVGDRARAQEGGKPKDDALESLLKDLAGEKKGETEAAKKAKPAAQKPKEEAAGLSSGSGTAKSGSGTSAAGDKPTAKKKNDGGKVAPKDQAIDDLLGKLGEAKDEPTAERESRGGGPGAERPQPGEKSKSSGEKLGGKDKDLDERLEELTGRKKKRNSSDQERSGPVGEMIKEMREVEERLGKPDPSETTQKKQKEIVKRIETMIEQARQSGSSGGRMMTRQVRQQGQQQGQKDGQEPGALARGAPPMKPAKPTGQHSTANGKDVWGHLPDELRQIMESSFKESVLESKRELVDRYFLTVSKGKRVRGE
jgi:ribosomal protein L17